MGLASPSRAGHPCAPLLPVSPERLVLTLGGGGGEGCCALRPGPSPSGGLRGSHATECAGLSRPERAAGRPGAPVQSARRALPLLPRLCSGAGRGGRCGAGGRGLKIPGGSGGGGGIGGSSAATAGAAGLRAGEAVLGQAGPR